MSAKTHIEAVPTPTQLLREAIARRGVISEEITRIEQKLQLLAPIHAEEVSAQSALSEVLRRDAEAMQAWMNEGAQGSAPEPDKKARDDAAHKLSQANAKMLAAGKVKAQLEREHTDAHQRRNEAQAAIADAETQIMADEFLRSATTLRDAYLAQLRAEAHFNAAKEAMHATNRVMASALTDRAAELLRPLNRGEAGDLELEIFQRAQRRFAALRAGEEPKAVA